MQTSNTKDFLYLTKGKLFWITSIHLFETCPNQKCQKGIKITRSKIDNMSRLDMFDLKFLI